MSHIFISYSHRDDEMMQRIRAKLRSAHLITWTDERLIPGTPSWQSSIQEAIEQATYIVVILSPASKKSPWVERELEYAQAQEVAIIPVLIAGTKKESVHFSIIDMQYIDLSIDFDAGIKKLLTRLKGLAVAQPHPPPKPSTPPRRRLGWVLFIVALVVIFIISTMLVVRLVTEKSIDHIMPTLAHVPTFQSIVQLPDSTGTASATNSDVTVVISTESAILSPSPPLEEGSLSTIEDSTDEVTFETTPDEVSETLEVTDAVEVTVAPTLPVIQRSPPTAPPATQPPVPQYPTSAPQPTRQQQPTSTLAVPPSLTPTTRPSWTPVFTATSQPTPTPTLSLTPSTPGMVQIIGSFVAPGDLPNGITCAGQSLWISDNGAVVFQTDMAGGVLAAHSAPEGSAEGIVWAGDRFFIKTTSRNLVYAFQIQSGTLASLFSFQSPSQTSGGPDDLAWDSANLWYADRYTVYKLDMTGAILSSFAFGWEVDSLAWDGTAFWVARNDFPVTFMRVNTQGQILGTYPSSLLEIASLDWCNGVLWAVGRDQYPGEYKVFRLSY